jgi:hypothetical protein
MSGHDVLLAHDLIAGTVEREAEVKAAVAAERKRKTRTRKPSLTARLKAVARAGLGAELKPDGTILTKEKSDAAGELANGVAANPWDEVLRHEDA